METSPAAPDPGSKSQIALSRKTVREAPKAIALSIAGEIDESNGRQLERYFDEAVAAERPRDVLLDMSAVTFASSAFFGSLLFWKEEVAKGGGRLVLFALQPQVASTMRIFAIDRVVTACPDQAAALAALAAG
jgi:anti-anti-sigma factor